MQVANNNNDNNTNNNTNTSLIIIISCSSHGVVEYNDRLLRIVYITFI